jgi:hypothetical protein
METRMRCLLLLALTICGAAHAVTLSGDGRGQALIFPYYTVRSSNEGSFNTYLSITNTHGSLKAVKLRLREGTSGAQVGELNLYLAAADMWTGALVWDDAGIRLVSVDRSCTNPAIPEGGFVFTPPAIDDAQGNPVSRSREGYIEAIEMATLQDPVATAVHDRACTRLLEGTITSTELTAPDGGLAGSATLINVRSARSFSYAATALDALGTRPYFSQPNNSSAFPGPSASTFESAAIDPVSVITLGDTTYRSTWSRSIDAVSAVLTANEMEGDYVLDPVTASKTDWVITFPTRNAYVRPGAESRGPFMSQLPANPCDSVYAFSQSRDDTSFTFEAPLQPRSPLLCWSSTVLSMRKSLAGPTSATEVLGSASSKFYFLVFADNGWIRVKLENGTPASLTPLSTIAFSATTGTASAANVSFIGLPAVGIALTTYNNGFLECGAAMCKGSYGSLVPLRRPVRVDRF